ncbi:MAG: exodeoxyribonuclease VII small subunit [Clostridia bacterium]|nr:exodeoxyribonuclease VII small subunit [Clostridia bacterium]
MKELTYEQAITRLEEIVQKLENSESTLDETMELFKQGVSLAGLCEEKLKTAEQQFTTLLKDEKE